MSIIYSLPLTNILVNGTRTYRIRTRDYDDVLQHVEVSSKTNETINLDFTDLYFQNIAFASNSDLGETTLKCIRNTMDIKNYYTVDSRPITCSAELKDEYLPELQFLVMRGYLIDVPVPQPIHIQSINIFGPESIKTEGSVEYFASIFPVDANEYNLGWYIDDAPTGVVARIRWTADDPKHAYLEIDSIDEGVDSELTIVCYDDVSGVEQSYSIRIYKEVVPVYIQNITISGPSSISSPGTYDYYATISPSDATDFDIDWSFVGSFSEPHLSIQTDPEDPLHCQLIVATPESSFGAAFAIECEDTISYNYDRFSVAVDIYVGEKQIEDMYYSIDSIEPVNCPGSYRFHVYYSPDDATHNFTFTSEPANYTTVDVQSEYPGDTMVWLRIDDYPYLDNVRLNCYDSVSGRAIEYQNTLTDEYIELQVNERTFWLYLTFPDQDGIEYQINRGEWQSYYGDTISLSRYDKLYLRGRSDYQYVMEGGSGDGFNIINKPDYWTFDRL